MGKTISGARGQAGCGSANHKGSGRIGLDWDGTSLGPSLEQDWDQPCRCLCLGLVQITITRPWRRITRHLSHILLTEARTFMVWVLSAFANRQPTTWVNPLSGGRSSEQRLDALPDLLD